MRAEPRRSVGGSVMHIGGRGVIAVSMNASVVSGIIDVGIAATTITPTFVTDRRRGCRWACAPLPRGDVCGTIKRTPVGNKKKHTTSEERLHHQSPPLSTSYHQYKTAHPFTPCLSAAQ